MSDIWDDEEDVEEILSQYVNEDGSVNFDKMREAGSIITLEELFPEFYTDTDNQCQ